MKIIRQQFRYTALVAVICSPFAWVPAFAADETITGNLTVTGSISAGTTIGSVGQIDSDANTLTFGTQGGSYGAALIYADNYLPTPGTGDTFTFSLNHSPASWRWMHNAGVTAMRLDGSHNLTLYKSDSATAGITLTPGSASLASALTIGGATLSATGTTLTLDGTLAVAQGINNTNGTLSGSTSSGLTLNAGGTNQNVTLNSSGGDLIFKTNGTEQARIKSTGKVGIGTTNPQATLQIGSLSDGTGEATYHGSLLFAAQNSTLGAAGGIEWKIASNNYGAKLDTISDGGANIVFGLRNASPSWTEVMRINPIGNVGIGTYAPNASLDIRKWYNAGTDSLRFSYDDAGGFYWMGIQPYVVASANVGYKFRTNNVSTTVDALAITGDGKIGIGTLAPSALLQVGANGFIGQGLKVGISGNKAGANAEILGSLSVIAADAVGVSTVGSVAYNYNGISGTSYSGAFLQYVGSSYGGDPYYGLPGANQGALVFQNVSNGVIASNGARISIAPAGNLAASFLANGNVGIGTTIPATKLQLTGDNVELSMGLINVDPTPYTRFGMTTAFDTYWATNATFASGAWNYVTTWGWGSKASRIDQGSGNLSFDTVSGGVNPIVWNTRLFIDNGGNIGIGITTPLTHKLEVNGTIRAKELIVDNTGWPDYVFADDYALTPLAAVEAHIKSEKHLPGIPSSQEIAEHGVSMGDMQARLLEKIEELTLHQIAQEKRLNEQATTLAAQAGRIRALEDENTTLRSR